MQRLTLLLLAAVVLTACVTKREVRTVEEYDYSMSCEALAQEIYRIENLRRDMESDSGFTGKNVGAALFFWPGILVNESRAGTNIKSADDRISHLNRVRAEKGCFREREAG